MGNSKLSSAVISADNYGLRTICGLLLRTYTDKIYDEASFQPLKTIIEKTTLKYSMNVVKKENQEMLRRFAFTRYRGKPRRTISKIKEL